MTPYQNPRLPLTASRPGARMFVTLAWLVLLSLWAALLVGTATATRLADRGGLFSLLLVIALATAIPLTIAMIETNRFAAWLEGRTLVIRHWNGIKRWDLPSATVTAEASEGTVRLTVRDEASGRRARLRLRTSELRHAKALARAIAAGRPGDSEARQAAEVLTQGVRASSPRA